MIIKVPATSANLGPGFDSCGVALNLYLELEVVSSSDTWYVEHEMGDYIPHDERNMIIATALEIDPSLKPHRIIVRTDIPTTRGLGSSSSAIVAGIELANRLGNLGLSDNQKVKLATKIEGHPDNVAPAILGSLVVASYFEEEVYYVKSAFPDCGIIGLVPHQELSTAASRNVLPSSIAYKDGVSASSIANVMVSALTTGDLQLAGRMMELDQWHESYRSSLVPHLKELRTLTHKHGGYGCFLSGAGPTVLILVPNSKMDVIKDEIASSNIEGDLYSFEIDNNGVEVI